MAQIVSVIKCDINNDIFIWKHPAEDFCTGSQLIVHESQEAVFFMNGQALDSFGPGRHTLETQNIPIISKLFNIVSGNVSPFHCEVYFINKTEQMAIKWGTPTKMEYMEPNYGFPIQLGACGEMNLQIANGRQLLMKVVGTEKGFTQAQVVDKFRALLQMRIKSYLPAYIKNSRINIFEIDEHLENISVAMQDKLKEDYLDYGIALKRFFVTTVIKPEDSPDYKRFKEIHFRQYADIAEAKLRQQVGIIDTQTEAQQMVIEAEGLARKRSLEGYTYQEERRFDVAETLAANEATGQFANMGIGLGMVSGIGGAVGNSVGNIVGSAMNQTALPEIPTPGQAAKENLKCCKCGASIASNMKFCSECGEKCVVAEVKFCPECGANAGNGKFCPECGCKLGINRCPQCQHEVLPGAKFCLECGSKLM